MSKSLRDMNLTELYITASQEKLKGRSRLKGRAKRNELIDAIIENRKQKALASGEEQKVDEEGRILEREGRILEEISDDSRDKIIEEALEEIEKDEKSRREETATEKLHRQARERQPPSDEMLRAITGKQPPLQIVKDVLSSDDSRRLLQQFNQSDLQKIKKLYEGASKEVQAHGIRNGLIRVGMKYGAPELSLLQQASDFLGTGYSDKDHSDLMKVIKGKKSGRSGVEDFKLGMKLVVNPVEWARLAGEEAFAVGENAITGISDVVRKVRGIKKDVRDPQADVAKGLMKERSDALKKKISQEKKLAQIKGEKYTGLSEDDILEDTLKMPRLSDFGGKDEKSALETLGETIAETALFVPKRAFGDEDEVMKKRLKEKDPEAFKRYEEAMEKYQSKKDRVLETRNENIKGDAVRLRSDLASVIDSVLEEERKNIKIGRQNINDSDLEELYDMSLTLRDNQTPISYNNLADIYAGIKTTLPKVIIDSADVKTKMGAFDYLEDTMLKPKTDTQADLRVSTNDKFQKTLEMKEEFDKKQKQIDDAIEEKRIDDERLEVIQSRADQITTGYVDTNSYGRPELKPRIIYGNTDAQLMPNSQSVRTARLFRESSLMWPQLETENNRRDNILYQRNLENERMRYGKTYSVPNVNKYPSVKKSVGYTNMKEEEDDLLVPSAYVRFSQRKLIPVYNISREEKKFMRDTPQAQAPFTKVEPETDFTVNMRRTERSMKNVFPERVLRNYKGDAITPSKRPNILENLRFTDRI